MIKKAQWSAEKSKKKLVTAKVSGNLSVTREQCKRIVDNVCVEL